MLSITLRLWEESRSISVCAGYSRGQHGIPDLISVRLAADRPVRPPACSAAGMGLLARALHGGRVDDPASCRNADRPLLQGHATPELAVVPRQ